MANQFKIVALVLVCLSLLSGTLVLGSYYSDALVFLVNADRGGGQIYYASETDVNFAPLDDSFLNGSFQQGFLDGDLVLYEGSSVLVLSTQSSTFLFSFSPKTWNSIPLDLGLNPVAVASLGEASFMTLSDNNLFNGYAMKDLIQGDATPRLSTRIATLESSSLSPLNTIHDSTSFQAVDTNRTFWIVSWDHVSPKTLSFTLPKIMDNTIDKVISLLTADGVIQGCPGGGYCLLFIDLKGYFAVWNVLMPQSTPQFIPLPVTGRVLSVTFKDTPIGTPDPPILIILTSAANGTVSFSIYDLSARMITRTMGVGNGSNGILYFF
jgi:hypothetical protein